MEFDLFPWNQLRWLYSQHKRIAWPINQHFQNLEIEDLKQLLGQLLTALLAGGKVYVEEVLPLICCLSN